MLTRRDVTPDLLRDYLDGRLSGIGREQVERAIRDDEEIARAFQMIREGMEIIQSRVELVEQIPVEWLTIISRWDLPAKR